MRHFNIAKKVHVESIIGSVSMSLGIGRWQSWNDGEKELAALTKFSGESLKERSSARKILSHCWCINEERKKMVLEVREVIIGILNLAKFSGEFPRSGLLLENNPSPNWADPMKMEIPKKTSDGRSKSCWLATWLAIIKADKMTDRTMVTMTDWKRPKRLGKCRGRHKLIIKRRMRRSPHNRHKGQAQVLINAKNDDHPRHKQNTCWHQTGNFI